MRRKLFTILAAISLLLCVATIALWIRTLNRVDIWCISSQPSYFAIRSMNGSISIRLVPKSIRGVNRSHAPSRHIQFAGVTFRDIVSPALESRHTSNEQMKVEWPQVSQAVPWEWGQTLEIRYGTLVAATLLCPAWLVCFRLWSHFRSLKFDRAKRCVACGYDIRATPERCPECGTETVKAEG